ncbi:hypothetical protein D7V94_19040 [Parablautia intestinalis]|uniref:Glucosyl transferase GtrII n=1 Tax=Parablautia intestinalis TaxID=2320100 RepID=A0A3A9AME4_9FIRM|nr:glucosyltransferase domain-containing protein [Parablautia intestinalis]RKI88673.1 hypothetical protein D7V94_19040 [Parablautia intestinalis]
MKDVNNKIIFFNDWLKKQQALLFCTIFILLMVYGIKVYNYNISIDTDIMMYYPKGNLKTYIASGRFAVTFTKLLLSTEIVNPFLLNFLAISILGLSTIVWIYILNLLSQTDYVLSNCLFSCIFLTHPLMAEQFEFTLQGMEVAISILLMAISIYNIFIFIKVHRKKFLLIGYFLMIWCFGTYQSFFVLYIMGCVISLIFFLDSNEDKKNIYWIRKIFLEIGIFLLGGSSYFIISNLFKNMFDCKNTYIEGMFKWKTNTIITCTINIFHSIKAVVFGEGTFYNKLYFILAFLILILFLYKCKKKSNNKMIYFVFFISLLLSPFLMSIVIGGSEPKRAQFYLPFMLAISYYYLSVRLIEIKKQFYFILCLMCLIVGFKQGVITARLFYTNYLRFEEDQQMVYELSQKMGEKGFLSGEQKFLAFIGKKEARLNNSAERGEIIGQTRFSGAPPAGSTPWAISFFRAYGYDFWEPGEEQYEKALQLSKVMPCWPENGSIIEQDGIIVVKLSEVD